VLVGAVLPSGMVKRLVDEAITTILRLPRAPDVFLPCRAAVVSCHADVPVWRDPLVLVSGALPSAVHDLTAARIWGIVRELAAAGLVTLSDQPAMLHSMILSDGSSCACDSCYL
jgi:hypothetical protein